MPKDRYGILLEIAKALVLIIAGEYIKDIKPKSEEG